MRFIIIAEPGTIGFSMLKAMEQQYLHVTPFTVNDERFEKDLTGNNPVPLRNDIDQIRTVYCGMNITVYPSLWKNDCVIPAGPEKIKELVSLCPDTSVRIIHMIADQNNDRFKTAVSELPSLTEEQFNASVKAAQQPFTDFETDMTNGFADNCTIVHPAAYIKTKEDADNYVTNNLLIQKRTHDRMSNIIRDCYEGDSLRKGKNPESVIVMRKRYKEEEPYEVELPLDVFADEVATSDEAMLNIMKAWLSENEIRKP